MARNVATTGYQSPVSTLFAPDRISDSILGAYQSCALTPQIANSDFLKEDELFCGSSVTFGVERKLSLFGQDTDNAESPEIITDPGLDTNTLTICQSKKFELPITNADKRIMCENFPKWEALVQRRIDRGIVELIDAYSVPKILASAAAYNTGNDAGKQTGLINLGTQDANALTANTVEGFEDAILSMREAAQQVGMMCPQGELAWDGEEAVPTLIIPSAFERYALKLMKDLNTQCSDQNVRRTGVIGSIYGFKVISSSNLVPMNFGSAGNLVNMMLVDPDRILHAFDIITNKWWEDKFSESLVGEFIWDTHVLDPDAVIVATSKV